MGADDRASELETHARANFDAPRIVDLPGPAIRQGAEVPGVAKTVERIKKLIVVEDVGEGGTHLQAEAFGERDVLLDVEIHVPEGLPAESSSSAVVTIVDTQDRIAEAIVDRCRVLVQGWAEARRSDIRILGRRKRVIVPLAAARVSPANVNGIFLSADVVGVSLPEALSATVQLPISKPTARENR